MASTLTNEEKLKVKKTYRTTFIVIWLLFNCMEIFLNIVADEKGISPYEKIAVVNNLLITPENDIF